MFGQILDIGSKKDYLIDMTDEAIENLTLDKKSGIRSAKVLTIELEGELKIQQDFKLRKFDLPKQRMVSYLRLKELTSYKINNKTKRLLRFILNKEFGEKISDLVQIDECPSDTEEEDVETTKPLKNKQQLAEGSTKEPLQSPSPEVVNNLTNEQLISMLNAGVQLPTAELFVESAKIPVGNETLTSEMKENILMLTSIGFLKEGKYKIENNIAILNEPLHNAFGDLLIGRQLKYQNNKTLSTIYGFSRLGKSDIMGNLRIKI
jgi:hypothetical protein